jgi:hypothetical protein
VGQADRFASVRLRLHLHYAEDRDRRLDQNYLDQDRGDEIVF